jgi:hypothetical protein
MNHILHACLALAAQAMLQCADADAAPVQPVFTNDTAANTLSFNDTFGHSVVVGTYNPITGLWTASGSNVTSVGLSAPSWLTVSGSPITTTGTLAITGTSQSANLVLASPNGSPGAVSPRALVAADLFSGCLNGQAFSDNAGAIGCLTIAGSGTVTSVSLTAPAWLTVTGSPITTAGTLAITSTSEPQNQVLASPNGSTGVMGPRALVTADLSNVCTNGQAFYNNAGAIACQSPGVGTVTSVAMTVPSWLAVSGSPITSSGTLAVTAPSQTASMFLASPSGGSGTLAPRTIVSADISSVLSSPPAIGNTAANSGAFTTLAASGAVSGAGITALFASPLAIGNTTPNSVASTSLSATGTTTLKSYVDVNNQGATGATLFSATGYGFPPSKSGFFTTGLNSQGIKYLGSPDYWAQTVIAATTTLGSASGETGLDINWSAVTGYQNPVGATTGQKTAIQVSGSCGSGGGVCWDEAESLKWDSGWQGASGNFSAVHEIDPGPNNSGTTVPTGGSATQIFGLWVGGVIGSFPVTSLIQVSPAGTNGAVFAGHYVINVAGNTVADLADFNTTSHTTNTFVDSGVHTNGMVLQGTYGSAGIITTGKIDFHYAGTTTCSVTGSIAVFINGVAKAIPYC